MGVDENSSINLAYVPNLTRHTYLLIRSRPHSYQKAIGPWNWVWDQKTQRKHNSLQTRVTSDTTTTEIGWTKLLTVSRIFHQTPCGRDRKITTKAWWEPRKTWVLDQVAQEQNQLPWLAEHNLKPNRDASRCCWKRNTEKRILGHCLARRLLKAESWQIGQANQRLMRKVELPPHHEGDEEAEPAVGRKGSAAKTSRPAAGTLAWDYIQNSAHFWIEQQTDEKTKNERLLSHGSDARDRKWDPPSHIENRTEKLSTGNTRPAPHYIQKWRESAMASGRGLCGRKTLMWEWAKPSSENEKQSSKIDRPTTKNLRSWKTMNNTDEMQKVIFSLKFKQDSYNHRSHRSPSVFWLLEWKSSSWHTLTNL
jgi:hypothetical protein